MLLTEHDAELVEVQAIVNLSYGCTQLEHKSQEQQSPVSGAVQHLLRTVAWTSFITYAHNLKLKYFSQFTVIHSTTVTLFAVFMGVNRNRNVISQR